MKQYLALLALVTAACTGTIGDGPNGGGGDDGSGGGGGSGSGTGTGTGTGTGSGVLPPDPLASGPGVVVYWGQNGYGGAHPGDLSTWEKPLADVCNTEYYDVIVLAFMTSFTSARNGGLPETNFSSHCGTPIDAAHPFLLACPDIADGIRACHAHGKKVLLSLGGAAGAYGFTSDDDARAFADTVWGMFLGGGGAVRPFGD